MLRGGAELVLHVGDISYANGDPDIWNMFMDYIEPYSAAAPYMLGIGNHEYDWRTGREKRHKHRHATDASGSDRPYDPDWGNYGARLHLGSSLPLVCMFDHHDIHHVCFAYYCTNPRLIWNNFFSPRWLLTPGQNA